MEAVSETAILINQEEFEPQGGIVTPEQGAQITADGSGYDEMLWSHGSYATLGWGRA